MNNNYIPIILCGGSGSRLFPLSRENVPKQFVRLTNDMSLIQNTILRFSKFQTIVLISNIKHKYILEAHIREISHKIPTTKIIIVLENEGRDTAPPIIYSLLNFNDCNLLFLPCDHIFDDSLILETINKCDINDNLITVFGIKATKPETGFGYIKLNNDGKTVDQFVEKPNHDVALQYIANGSYYWNSGMFMIRSSNEIINCVKSVLPNTVDVIQHLSNKQYYSDGIFYIELDKQYSLCDNISIDFGLLEKMPAKSISMIKYDGIWKDIGTFASLINQDNQENNFIKTTNNDKIIITEGVNNLVIVDTDDVLLVTTVGNSQNIKKIYNSIKNNPDNKINTFINENNIDFRPWGFYEVLSSCDQYKIKKISVYPKKRLSLQSHKFRKEVWTVLTGSGQAVVGDDLIDIKEGQNIIIEIEQKHRLINNTDDLLEIIELQTGSYLGEDDIVRYEDDFNRTN